MNDNDVRISIRRVSKTYRRGSEEIGALREVTFALRRGEFAVLVGPSGSGKSTLLSMICGWELPDAGEVSLDDHPVTGPIGWVDLAVVPQTLGLMEELSIHDNIRWPVRLSGDPPTEVARVQELLVAFGLSELAHRYPQEVSLGEQQRAAVARALVLNPSVFLADEPTGHQDEAWAREVLSVAHTISSRGGVCLIATHDPQAVLMGDRVLTMSDGEVSEMNAGI